ncbi:hypothetical protein B0H14DRAFT_3045129, partial [Mycena olivaceomarginata]
MECRPEMGRPSAGAYWLSLAMSAAVLMFLLRLIWLDLVGNRFSGSVTRWVERMTRGIQWREWKENSRETIWF